MPVLLLLPRLGRFEGEGEQNYFTRGLIPKIIIIITIIHPPPPPQRQIRMLHHQPSGHQGVDMITGVMHPAESILRTVIIIIIRGEELLILLPVAAAAKADIYTTTLMTTYISSHHHQWIIQKREIFSLHLRPPNII